MARIEWLPAADASSPTPLPTVAPEDDPHLRPATGARKDRSGVTSPGSQTLVSGFVDSTARYPERPALFVEGAQLTYRELATLAGAIAATLAKHAPGQGGLGALLAHRSRTAYAGILGLLLAGRGYVPLNPRFPVLRSRRMLEQSGTEVLLVGPECLEILEELLETWPSPLVILLPDLPAEAIEALESRFPAHRFLTQDRLEPSEGQITLPRDTKASDIAYLLFTSGSTGEPKGVPVVHGNVRAYVDYTVERYQVGCEDRLSQAFDLTFDLSVHDMFVAWERGACLYCIPETSVSTPARFIRDQGLTLWFSVPSAASIMSRMRLLRPGIFPSLRVSLFCGEALPLKTLQAWQAAAPQSVIENLYGPTEATIAITNYRWDGAESEARCHNGIVPIGWAFEGQSCCVVDENLEPVAPGEAGELLLGGSQVTPGYWKNPEQTGARYVTLADGKIWYRTGDRVIEGPDGCLIYLGRFDDQVKIRGYRVELQEIDSVLREVCESEQVASVAWPVKDGIAEGVTAFVCQPSPGDEDAIIQRCREGLPDHMVPRSVVFVPEMPRNANGKIDRGKLKMQLEEARGDD